MRNLISFLMTAYFLAIPQVFLSIPVTGTDSSPAAPCTNDGSGPACPPDPPPVPPPGDSAVKCANDPSGPPCPPHPPPVPPPGDSAVKCANDPSGPPCPPHPGKPVGAHKKEHVKSAVRRPELPLIILPQDIKVIEAEEHIPPGHVENLEDAVEQIYINCDYSRGCIGEPYGCLMNKNCEILVAWGREWDMVRFEVVTRQFVYAAVGLSFDVLMGNDSVTECVREKDHAVFGYTSWNDEQTNTRLRSCVPMQDFRGVSSFDHAKHIIYCTWKRPVETTVRGHNFDLNEPLYILLAVGTTASPGLWGNIVKHQSYHIHAQSMKLSSYFGKSPAQYYLGKIHGVLMILLWAFVAPLAIFIVRYFKGTFPEVRILKHPFWYSLHKIPIMSVLTLTGCINLLLIIVDHRWAVDMELMFSAHIVIGFIMSVLIVAQVAVAFFMFKHPGKFKLVRLTFIHGLIGHLIFAFGYASLHSSRYARDGLPCDTTYPLFFYIFFYILVHIFMSFLVCYADFVQGKETARVYRVFLIDRPEDPQDPEEEEPGARARKWTLVVFVPLLLGFTVYFIIVTLLPGHYDCITKERMAPVKLPTLELAVTD